MVTPHLGSGGLCGKKGAGFPAEREGSLADRRILQNSGRGLGYGHTPVGDWSGLTLRWRE